MSGCISRVQAVLVPYDPSWPDHFRAAAESLKQLGNPQWTVEHIGSTAIPGLSAKPIIDLAVRVEDARDFQRHRPALERDGWRTGSSVRAHDVMLRERDGTRTHIAHFFASAVWGEVNQRLFRDWLLAHPTDALRYQDVKRLAVEDAAAGLGAYNAAKTTIVQELVDRARAERGLPSVSVSDK
jgi:GrpB-like predicted nucleotidyltransferase (UPF0157 family)